jgi:hypothetical protein
VKTLKNYNRKAMNRQLNFSSTNLGNLSQNTAHQFAAQRALRIYRADAIYSYIPKNACSTMRLSLAIENGCITNEASYGWFHNNNNTFSSDLASLIKARYTFVILRCPFARLASAYLDKIVGNEPDGVMFASMIGSFGVGSVTFRDFVRAMKNPEIRDVNPHWRPQKDFLVYGQYDDYFCLEAFSDAARRIQDRTGMTIYDAREITGHGLGKFKLIDQGSHANLRAADISSLKGNNVCPSPRSLYNDELIEIVNKAFAEDIAIYERHFGKNGLMFTS